MNRNFLPLIFMGMSLGAGSGFGQSPAPATGSPAFDVASVKPSSPASNGHSLMMSEGKFFTENQSLMGLIKFAYTLKSDDQLIGAPAWVASKGFDIDAKEDAAFVEAAKTLSPEQRIAQIRLMVQALLQERFHLQVSRETRELPVYALVVAKGGPKMTAMPPPDLSRTSAPPPAPGDAPVRRRGSGIRSTGRGDLTGLAATMDLLTNVLSNQNETAGRLVLDKTGLTGNYDWTLKWTPEKSESTVSGGSGNAGADETGPSFFTAIQEQLGLKLESQKGPVAVVVIAHVELPDAN
jgi:uncharacterized protein (TIGR03435 family)